MKYEEFNKLDKIEFVKNELKCLVKSVFEKPEMLKDFILDKRLSREESKAILKKLNSFNSKTCVCCRMFDSKKFKFFPLDSEIEPLVDIARSIAESKNY